MSRLVRLACVTACALLLAGAAPAGAAERKAPFGFFATVLPPEMTSGKLSRTALARQMGLMARSGVESVRVTLDWAEIEGAPGAYDYARLDRVVGAAAGRRIRILLNVTATPRWASSQPGSDSFWRWPPADPAGFGRLMGRLVARYGPDGRFWSQRRRLPKVPVRQWQIWNEQSAPWHWEPQPWAPGYVPLLRAAHEAVHAADRGATVVAGSLVAAPENSTWDAADALYAAGARDYFDALAIHPFTNAESVGRTIFQLTDIARRVRVRMNRNGDRRKPILVSEMTWTAAAGQVPPDALIGFETTPEGQAARLEAAYRALAAKRRKLGIAQAYWYTWATQYDPAGPPSVASFRYSGLNRLSGASFSRLPLLRAYSGLAAVYEGCRKTADARRCRR